MSSPSPASAPARSPQPPPPPPPPAVNTSAPPPPVSTSPPSPPGLPRGALAALVVGIGIGGLIVFVGMCVCVYCYRKRKRNMMEMMAYPPPSSEGPKEDAPAGQHLLLEHDIAPSNEKASSWPKPTPPLGIASSHPSLEPNVSLARPPSGLGFTQSTFTYEELRRATNGFSSANLLGQGGYGYVHKGVLSDGKIVAVKQLRAGSGQGEREFRAEVEIISRIHHRHLVSLVGYCISGAQRILVYEFVPNCTMEFHLHGKEAPTLSWPIRLRIALGSARGLAYLHEDCNPKIIHRDIKGSNILLDFSFEAKVADFGLAKLALDTETHVSTRVMGTFGYLAPEYASSGKLTEKSDVYSFGVVLLELITGRRPIDKSQPFAEDSMVDWARPLLASALEGGNFDAIVDPKLQNDYDTNEMTQMIACAAACVRHSARRRPQMSQVVRALEGNLTPSDLTEGIIPGQSQVFRAYKSSDYDSGQYREDLKKFRKMALGSQELATSECSGSTSESGVLPSSSSSGGGHQTTQEMEPEKMEEEKFRRMTLESPEQATSEYSVPSGKSGVLLASSSSGGGHQTTQEMELEKMEEEKVRNLPLESQEQTTTDCSGLTSESGAPPSSSSSGVGHKTSQEVESEKMEEKLRSLALESQEQTTTDCSGPTNESGVPPSSSNSGVGYQTTQGMVSEKTEEVARDAGETSQK